MFRVGHQITLTQQVVDKAYRIGMQRYQSNRKGGVQDTRVDDDWYMIDGEGVCGEAAFAQMISAPQEQWDRIEAIRNPCEAECAGDVRYMNLDIDVKVTKYPNGHLILTQKKFSNLADGYVLMVGFQGSYEFRGFISRYDIKKDVMKFKIDHRGAVWIPQSFLGDLL